MTSDRQKHSTRGILWLRITLLVILSGLGQLVVVNNVHDIQTKIVMDDSPQHAQLRTNRTTASSGQDGISLLISFWAEKERSFGQLNPHAHRREIEAAMLTNLQNPHLHQVVVILDSVNANTTDCRGFVHYMTQRLDNITRSSSFVAPP